jgi:hypothetical protein
MYIRTGWSGSAKKILFLCAGEKRRLWQEDEKKAARQIRSQLE